LRSFLDLSIIRRLFRIFLAKRNCLENLDFYYEIQMFKHCKSPKMRQASFDRIIRTYILANSSFHVNLSAKHVKSILRSREALSASVFASIEQDVLRMMRSHFVDFQKTCEYKELEKMGHFRLVEEKEEQKEKEGEGEPSGGITTCSRGLKRRRRRRKRRTRRRRRQPICFGGSASGCFV